MKHEEQRFFKFCCKNIEHLKCDTDELIKLDDDFCNGKISALRELDNHIGNFRLKFRNKMNFKDLVELYSERYNVSKHLLIYYIKKWRDKGIVSYYNRDDQMDNKDEELLLYGYFNFIRLALKLRAITPSFIYIKNEYNNILNYINMIPERITYKNVILKMHISCIKDQFINFQ